MGECKYCGQDAGFFSKAHKGCEEKHQQGMAEVLAAMHSYFKGQDGILAVTAKVAGGRQNCFLTGEDVEDCGGKAIELFADNITFPITKQHIVLIDTFLKNLGASRMGLNKNGALDKLAMRLHQGILLSQIRGQLEAPKAEKRVGVVYRVLQLPMPGNAPQPMIMLEAGETVIWAHQNVKLFQEKIEKEWVGRNRGFSFRVMKGVYYRTGGSRGHAVEHSTMQQEGVGSLIFTNKNLIFYSPNKSIKVPYKKILGLVPYSDGVEIQRDGANAKRLTFQGFDSWFMVNLMSNINI